MRKEDIHISLLKEILIEAGYTKEQTDLVDFETILISDDTLYVLLEIDGDGFAINLDTYMTYHNWWKSVERDNKINDIINDNLGINIKHGVQINFRKTPDTKKQLICYKNLPNGKLTVGKLYEVEHVYNGKTNFSTYVYYTIAGAYFSSEKYDPYFVGNYFTTKAQLRDMRIDEILND